MKGAAAGAIYYLAELGGLTSARPGLAGILTDMAWAALSPGGLEVYYYLTGHAEAEGEHGFLMGEDK